jgi:hypothetical protein
MVQTCYNAQLSGRILCDRTSISKEKQQCPHTTTPNQWFKHALTHKGLDVFFVIAHPSQRRKNSVHTQLHQKIVKAERTVSTQNYTKQIVQTCFNAQGSEVFFVIAHPSQSRKNSVDTQLHQTNCSSLC